MCKNIGTLLGKVLENLCTLRLVKKIIVFHGQFLNDCNF